MRCGIIFHGQRAASALESFRALRFIDGPEFTREDDCRILLVLDPHLSAEESSSLKPEVSTTSERFERPVTICASLAWHFYENNSLLQFRSAGVETPLPLPPTKSFRNSQAPGDRGTSASDPHQSLMADLAASPELFRSS